jgi:hypothetical protein
MLVKEKKILFLFVIQQFLMFVKQENQQWEHKAVFLPPL